MKTLALQLPAVGSNGTPQNIPISLPPEIGKIVQNTTAFGGNIIFWGMNVAFVLGTLTALSFLVWGGWKWIISNGDPKNLEEAHSIIIYAAVGLAIMLLSAAFINTAAAFFCVPFLGWTPASCPTGGGGGTWGGGMY